MPSLFPTLDPGLRALDAAAHVILGPVYLAPRSPLIGTVGMTNYGLSLQACDVEYVPEFLGPWFNASYSRRWRLLGYRPAVNLVFGLAEDDSVTEWRGLRFLRALYDYGLRIEEGYSLSFNLYAGNTASAWRQVRPTGNFAPKKAGAVQGVGWELELPLETVDLVPAASIGEYRNSKW